MSDIEAALRRLGAYRRAIARRELRKQRILQALTAVGYLVLTAAAMIVLLSL